MKIDFVLLWVDGEDPKWQEECLKYAKHHGVVFDASRYRSWDNLHYLFRAFERFTPWVNKIHFVTYGHLPSWLNVDHPKLNIVVHETYIDKKYLPLFNVNALEICFQNIPELSEYFVYFNDDTFIIDDLPKERFFKNGLPCDQLVCNAISSSSGAGHFVLNDIEVLNRHFSKKHSIKKDFFKWFHPKYGTGNLRNIALLPWPRFTGFMNPHMPQPFLKNTFEELWEKEEELLEKTVQSKFRECYNVNQYLFRYWQLAKGSFSPSGIRDMIYVEPTIEDLRNGVVSKVIEDPKYRFLCINDNSDISNKEFREAKQIVVDAFEHILPDKSEYEL